MIAAGGLSALSAAKDVTNGADDEGSGEERGDCEAFSGPVEPSFAGVTISVGPPMDLDGDGELTLLDAVVHAVVVTAVDTGRLDLMSDQADAVDVDRDGDVHYDDASALAKEVLTAETGGDEDSEDESNDSDETTTADKGTAATTTEAPEETTDEETTTEEEAAAEASEETTEEEETTTEVPTETTDEQPTEETTTEEEPTEDETTTTATETETERKPNRD